MKPDSTWIVVGAAGVMAASGSAFADDTEDLAEAAQNPIANMISLPIRAQLQLPFLR